MQSKIVESNIVKKNFIIFFEKIRIGQADKSHEMSSLIFYEK